MTTSALVLLFVISIVMAALGRWNHNRRRQATTHNDELGRTAPRWAGVLDEKLNRLLAGQRRLHQHIGFEAEADERRDIEMSAAHDAIIAELAAATTERGGFLVLLQALKDGQGNPAKLEEIAASVKSGRQEWITAFDQGVPPPVDPPV